jgi:hypothetical protein
MRQLYDSRPVNGNAWTLVSVPSALPNGKSEIDVPGVTYKGLLPARPFEHSSPLTRLLKGANLPLSRSLQSRDWHPLLKSDNLIHTPENCASAAAIRVSSKI